jgi:single-stranded-DNA-specific exonuclease
MHAQNISQDRLHPVVLKLLQKRGFDTQQIDDFFSWDLKQLPDFKKLKDIEKTGQRIIQALEHNEKIGIYGDYDVDGTTSCALFYHFFKMLGVVVELIQPSRFKEGYGIHPSSIEDAIQKEIKLLITVDCGISNTETADYALSRDLDLIITDHHKDIQDEMPSAYSIVNPNRRDEPSDSPMTALAGVGVAFAVCVITRNLLIEKARKVDSLYPLLQFVAIGTLADLAPLNAMNIKLVRHGLAQIPKSQYPGIQTFLNNEERNLKSIPSEKISFFIGPMINSKGRLDHPEVALKTLIASDKKEALENYLHLENSNLERKRIQKEVFEEAKKQVINSINGDDIVCAIVYSKDWHEGVIGIVASKLVETFKVPALVFTDASEEGIIKASCRSAGELNLFQYLDASKDFFLKFGGHKAAAGLSMEKDRFQDFKKHFIQLLKEVPHLERTQNDFYDLNINFDEIDADLVKQLECLEPFGMGNAKPVFKVSKTKLNSYDLLKDIHVRWNFESLKDKKKIAGISFNYVDKWGHLSPNQVYHEQTEAGIDVTCTLGVNRFRGNEFIQLMVNKVEPGL